MPLYEYQCEDHGRFEGYAPLEASRDPATCPVCRASSRRVISLPALKTMSRQKMAAMEKNERSREAPHVCGAGCHHHHSKPKKDSTPPGQPPALQSYTGPRPWVVEHA